MICHIHTYIKWILILHSFTSFTGDMKYMFIKSCIILNTTEIGRSQSGFIRGNFQLYFLEIIDFLFCASFTHPGCNEQAETLLAFFSLELMYSSLILSHLQFAITSLGFEWERLSKFQKRAIRIMIVDSNNNAHTDQLLKSLKLL